MERTKQIPENKEVQKKSFIGHTLRGPANSITRQSFHIFHLACFHLPFSLWSSGSSFPVRIAPCGGRVDCVVKGHRQTANFPACIASCGDRVDCVVMEHWQAANFPTCIASSGGRVDWLWGIGRQLISQLVSQPALHHVVAGLTMWLWAIGRQLISLLVSQPALHHVEVGLAMGHQQTANFHLFL